MMPTGYNENKIAEFLEGLIPADFARVLTRFPNAPSQVPNAVTHYERVHAFLQYIRSSNGPKIPNLVEALGDLFPEFVNFISTIDKVFPSPFVVKKELKTSKAVFISYRHTEPDATLAHILADALRQSGHTPFIDTGIRWGEDWTKRIYDALFKCDFLLLLLSHESAKSEMVAEEARIATTLHREPNRAGRPIILPVRVQYPFIESLPYELSARLNSIQQTQWVSEADTSALVDLLLQTVSDPSQWRGEVPVDATPIVPTSNDPPPPQVDPRLLRLVPGGAIAFDDPHYIERDIDQKVLDTVLANRGLATLVGARQTGKTSLILRTMNKLQEGNELLRPALIDFQTFDTSDISSVSRIWRRIVMEWTIELGLKWTPNEWQDNAIDRVNLDAFFSGHLFANSETPVLLCFDEADHILTHQVGPSFFATVRAFWGLGARNSYWKRVRWLISASTEPALFISDLRMSPFNIGHREELKSFTPEEVKIMVNLFGQSYESVDSIYTFTGGHPYLTHQVLYQMARTSPPMQLLSKERAGTFREHLHRFLLQFQAEPELRDAMREIVNGGICKDARSLRRIELAGLVHYDNHGRCIPSCGLYADFFREALA